METQLNQQPENANEETEKDINDNKVMAVLAYFLFFIPLLAAKESKYAMYHANQGLVLFLSAVVVNIIGSIIPIIGWFLIIPIANLMILILAIIGIINAAGGKKKPLPLIGGIKIIKE